MKLTVGSGANLCGSYIKLVCSRKHLHLQSGKNDNFNAARKISSDQFILHTRVKFFSKSLISRNFRDRTVIRVDFLESLVMSEFLLCPHT